MEENQPQQELKNLISIPCSACGAQMKYDAKTAQMLCENCGNTQEVPTANDRIIERNLTEDLVFDDAESGFGVEMKSFKCRTCGSITDVAENVVSITCDFCGSENVNLEAQARQVIKPAGILPFIYPREKALAAFKEWIGSGWFHPSKLAKLARLEKINGVYVPFWTYDASTDSQWTAEAGYYYYVDVQYTDENGDTQTRQEQRVNWVPASGYFQHFFDDVLVVGSHGLSQGMVERIYPYELGKVVNYEPKFILGWKAEVYQRDVKEGFGVADKIMDNFIYARCGEMVPGDTHRFLQVNTHKYDITFKHILLPVWIAAYQYGDKTYQFVVNGQTGAIGGEKPLSWVKIVFTVLLVVGIIALIIILTKK